MKRRVMKAVGLALALAGAFGAGMWFMYFIQWVGVFTKLIEMTEKVFQLDEFGAIILVRFQRFVKISWLLLKVLQA
jgi:hypothetical protein